jgi:type I restriction enzyme S subunit
VSNKYDSYKDSGIEWIGEIPSHWEINKFGRATFFQEGPGLRNWQFTESGIKVICVTNIVPPYIDFSKMTKYISEEEYETTYKHFTVKKGDIMLASSGASWGKVAEYIEEETVILNTSTIRLNEAENKKVKKEFIKWVIQSAYISESLNILLTGSCQPNFGPTHLNKLTCVYPINVEEQTAIANYLDHKTTQIDDLIAKKERLIQLLEEERVAVINQAVTKGLDPTVPMKDSGIEWLGEIPAHWNLKRMRYLCDITTGGRDTENREDDGLYPFYVRSQTVERISSYSFDGEAILTAGDGVGVCKVWHYVNEKFDFHQRVYMMCNFQQVLGKYLFFYLKENFGKEVMKLSAKSTVDSLRRPMFQNFLVCFGSIDEQKQIVLKIEKEENRIQTIIGKTQQEIELLKEYKTALISEVVTGKVDVRNEKLN